MTAVPPTPAPAPPYKIDPDRGMLTAFIGYGLLLISVCTGGLSGFIAMILAYDRKGQSGPVPRTHFAFQLRIFWVCFALSLTAGALWIGALFNLLLHPPLPRPMIHPQPDTQMVRIAQAWLQPADVQTWSYHFEASPMALPHSMSLQMALGVAMMTGAVLFSWIGPIFGMIRLAAGRPIGPLPDPVVEPAP
jgi:uncharacterized membrane protein